MSRRIVSGHAGHWYAIHHADPPELLAAPRVRGEQGPPPHPDTLDVSGLNRHGWYDPADLPAHLREELFYALGEATLLNDTLADDLVWKVEHGALGVQYRFTTIMARDAWIERHFPKREMGTEDVPGLYDLPDGRQLGVHLLGVHVYDAR